MSSDRTLPQFTNPLMVEDKSPAYEILVERRCLGSTELKVKAGQIGTSNATQPDNLGILDYAHLRVPLPVDLSTSGIFHKGRDRKYPESYFLMRRSSDGYISATGMFKAAFPYAQVEEEAEEKAYIKSLKNTPEEEVAGNVWIHPDEALALAEEYGIRHWILALLDPEPIEHGTGDKNVTSPPAYRKHRHEANGTAANKSSEKKTPGRTSTRVRPPRGARSASPSESQTVTRPKATPGRGRGRTRRNKAADDNASVTSEAVHGDADTVKVEVETVDDGTDQKTKIKIDMPASHPDLVLPDNAEAMIEQARQMVKDAEKISGAAPSRGAKGKRKAAEMVDEESEEGPAANKRRVETQVRKETIRRRALTGLAATLALGALIPSIMTGLQSLA